LRLFIPLLLILTTPAAADDPPARVRSELSPRDSAWVGQRVTLAITLSTPDLFAGVPSFDMPDVAGAVVLPPAGSAVVGSETIDGESFTTQRHEFAIYAQRAEVVRIPAFVIRFESNSGFGTPAINRDVTTTDVSFTARTPPGAEGLGVVIAARNLKVRDEWQPEPKSVKVGDAFTRTVTVTADDVPGMVFPAFRLGGVDGLAAYPKEPAVNDHSERGSLTGERVESITYVCEAAGNATIPSRSLTWYDLDASKLKTVKIPGRTFAVAPAVSSVSTSNSPAPPKRPRWWQAAAAVAALLTICGLLAARFWPVLAGWAANRAECESRYFGAFGRACRSDDPHRAYVALLQWLDRFRGLSLDEFTRLAGEPRLTAAIADLTDRVYVRPNARPPAGWSGNHLFSLVARTRRGLRSSTVRCASHALPHLNPTE
jgi:hypothetical protein